MPGQEQVGPLVEHAPSKPDGAKAKRCQKLLMSGRIVAAKGPSVFSALFENGHTKDKRSNALAFVDDPQFAAPPPDLHARVSPGASLGSSWLMGPMVRVELGLWESRVKQLHCGAWELSHSPQMPEDSRCSRVSMSQKVLPPGTCR